VKLSRGEFARRLAERFHDPAFDDVRDQIARRIDVAWDGYDEYRKSPGAHRRAAGRTGRPGPWRSTGPGLPPRRPRALAPGHLAR
jgi:hypothetical protein